MEVVHFITHTESHKIAQHDPLSQQKSVFLRLTKQIFCCVWHKDCGVISFIKHRINQVNNVKYPGVFIDSGLKWSIHVQHSGNKVS